MAEESMDRELIAEAAAEYGVPYSLLEKLLMMAEGFTDSAAYGAKADFARQIAQALDSFAQQQAST